MFVPPPSASAPPASDPMLPPPSRVKIATWLAAVKWVFKLVPIFQAGDLTQSRCLLRWVLLSLEAAGGRKRTTKVGPQLRRMPPPFFSLYCSSSPQWGSAPPGKVTSVGRSPTSACDCNFSVDLTYLGNILDNIIAPVWHLTDQRERDRLINTTKKNISCQSILKVADLFHYLKMKKKILPELPKIDPHECRYLIWEEKRTFIYMGRMV